MEKAGKKLKENMDENSLFPNTIIDKEACVATKSF